METHHTVNLENRVVPAGNAEIHDMDARGRAMQEQLPRSHGWLQPHPCALDTDTPRR